MATGKGFWDGVENRWTVVYKIDVLAALKAAGYPSTRLRDDKIIGQATIQRLRKGDFVSWDVLADLCFLLHCDLSDIIECRTDSGEVASSNPALVQFPPKVAQRERNTVKKDTEQN